MPIENLSVSSEQFVVSAMVVALSDAAFIWLLVRQVKPARFRELKWTLVGTAAVFWSIYGLVLVQVFWDSYYRYFFPASFRSSGILLFVPLVYGFLALIYHVLAFRLPGNPIVVFCLLAGFESLLEHLWGISGFRILEVPMMQDASPLSILFFAIPEYIFYWCLVICLAVLFQNGWRWLVRPRIDHSRL